MRRALLLAAVVVLAGPSPARADDGDAPPAGDLEEAFRVAADRAAKAVVRIEPIAKDGNRATPLSGVIVDRQGLILTSSTGLEGAPMRSPAPSALAGPFGAAVRPRTSRPVVARVTLPDGRRLDARLLGRDHQRDLALLRVDPPAPLVMPHWKDGARLRLGQLTVAVGRGAPGLGHTMTTGILSATGRFKGRAVQTDAKVNRRNLGGALASLEGRVIGVIVEMSDRPGLNSGVGFAIPVWEFRKVIPVLARGHDVERPPPPFLGVTMGSDGKPGIPVTGVVPGSAAELAGVKKGDRLLAVGGKPLANARDLRRLLGRFDVGEKVTIRVLRKGEEKDLEAILAPRPKDVPSDAGEGEGEGEGDGAPEPDEEPDEEPDGEPDEDGDRDDGGEPDDGEDGDSADQARRVTIRPGPMTLAIADDPPVSSAADDEDPADDEGDDDRENAIPDVIAPADLRPGVLGALTAAESSAARADIRRLEEPDWAVRQAATERLAALEGRALDVLLDGAASDDPEVRSRCLWLLHDLVRRHTIATPGYLGITYTAVTPPPPGYLAAGKIESVIAGRGAERAGLRAGDVIVRIDGSEFATVDEMVARVVGTSSGHALELVVIRAGVGALTFHPVLTDHPSRGVTPDSVERAWQRWLTAVGRPEVARRRRGALVPAPRPDLTNRTDRQAAPPAVSPDAPLPATEDDE